MSYSDPKFDLKFGEFLVESNLLSYQVMQEALKNSTNSNRSFVDVLCQDHQLDESLLYQLLAQKTGVTYADLQQERIDDQVIKTIPVKIAWHYGFMPLRLEKSDLVIAVEAPFNIKIQDEIRLQLGRGIVQRLCRKKDIVECFKKYYGFAADTVDKIVSSNSFQAEAVEEKDVNVIQQDEKLAGDATVVDLVNEIILEAYQKRATDIHFEPYRGEFRLRYRIDGVLQDVNLSPRAKPLITLILSRIKILSSLDIIEKRLPQDGRAVVQIKNQTLDLRISSIPTLNGESIVIRILPTQMIFDLQKLGLNDKNVKIFEQLIQKPHGIVLLTGPTGSGKTTTLYACLNRINSKERKIITIEDPVEYEISGITQIQISPKTGLDFAKGLRSMLRHDPDIMMVGEIRDFETAEISIRAALTGHLVFSTLHTNNAASGVTRLLDIGLEPFLVSSSLEAIIAQRLVRKICPKCKVEDSSHPAALIQKIVRDLRLKSARLTVFKGKGCEYCSHTGFYGRTAIHEVLLASPGIKELIMRKASGQEIHAKAIAEGMTTLLQDGWQKVLNGQTTPAEVIHVVSTEADVTGPDAEQNPPASAPEQDMRSYQRTQLPFKVFYVRIYYKIVTKKQEKQTVDDRAEYTGRTENLSASGLLMKVDKLLNLEEILELRFEPLEGSGRFVQCVARVVRVEESTEKGIYFVGLMFLDLTSGDRVYLDRLVSDKKWEKSSDAGISVPG